MFTVAKVRPPIAKRNCRSKSETSIVWPRNEPGSLPEALARSLTVLRTENFRRRVDLDHELVAAVGSLQPQQTAAVEIFDAERHGHVGHGMDLLVPLEPPAIIEAVIGDLRRRLRIVAAGACVVIDQPADVVTGIFRMCKASALAGPVASGVLRPPARHGAGAIVVVYEDPQRPLLPKVLALNLAVSVNIAVFDLDRLAGQTDHPLDHKSGPLLKRRNATTSQRRGRRN